MPTDQQLALLSTRPYSDDVKLLDRNAGDVYKTGLSLAVAIVIPDGATRRFVASETRTS